MAQPVAAGKVVYTALNFMVYAMIIVSWIAASIVEIGKLDGIEEINYYS